MSAAARLRRRTRPRGESLTAAATTTAPAAPAHRLLRGGSAARHPAVAGATAFGLGVRESDLSGRHEPSSPAPVPQPDSLELAGLHALLWLVIGNAVGVLLALLLAFPSLGSLLGPLGYGRWVPLHLDLQLYGWCSLPLVALLLRFFRPRERDCPGGALAVGAWSAALAVGSVSWLAGESSGKLFLDWSGPARLALPAAMAVLMVALWRGRLAHRAHASTTTGPAPRTPWDAALLFGLMPVPVVLAWAAGPDVYPPFNPESGGATGGSLLGSSLGIVAVVLLSPLLAELPHRPGAPRAAQALASVLALHFLVFGLAGHGPSSHHELGQRLLLASLLPWAPLVVLWLRSFEWPPPARRWLGAAAIWSGLLLLTSLATFQPGVLERAKFTNTLVAHSHLAMAGAITSFHGALLVAVHRGDRLAGALGSARSWWLWQVGCAAHVAALLAVGMLEGADPGRLFRPDLAASAWYLARLLAGIAMLWASVLWLRRAWRSLGRALPDRDDSWEAA
jgi:cytochrome c oxidase cbb3-type subunit 1